MKFLATKTITPFFKTLMITLTLFILLFLVSDIALHHTQIGLTIGQAQTTLFGNEESFEEPIVLSSLLLQVHIDLFFTLFVVLIILAIYIRLYEKSKSTREWIHALSILGFLSPLFLLLTYFFKIKIIVVLWIAIFIVWHIASFYLSLKIIWKLFKI